MSAQRGLLCDTAQAVFGAAPDMAAVEAAGFPALLVPEADGGFGGDWGDLFAVMRIAGAHALDLPVGETIVAAALGAPWADLGEGRMRYGAYLKVAQAAGALDAALALSIDYVNNRQQFGRALGKFQAVQQNLALLAAEAAAVNVAGQAAAGALDREARGGANALFEIAAAKLRTNRAIGIATGIAHQVHGAIGFTQEYGLNRLTLRLIRWRSEFGNDAHWADLLGGLAAAQGGTGLWQDIAARSDAC